MLGKSSENARMIMAMGITAINGVVFTGRIYASEKGNDSDNNNFPELLLV